jgi:hypothetical protein
MLRPLLVSLLICTTTLTATAQQTSAPQPSMPTANDAITRWPQSRWSLPREVIVVTLTNPGVRQRCDFPDLTADTLTCTALHHHPPTTHKREDVASLIQPKSHKGRYSVIAFLAISGGLLASSFFVPTLASIFLRFSSFWFLLGSGWVGDYDDSNQDKLLYQRPSTPLTITLRTH